MKREVKPETRLSLEEARRLLPPEAEVDDAELERELDRFYAIAERLVIRHGGDA